MSALEIQGQKARAASAILAVADTARKNSALAAIAEALLAQKTEILAANSEDMQRAKENDMRESLRDRLALNESRIKAMADGLQQLIELPDPVGEAVSMAKRPNGLTIARLRVPLGVIAIIFEARPNVTVDAAALCLKAGNAVILRGGKEAISSNTALVRIMRAALKKGGLPEDSVALVADTSRESARELMRLNDYIDVLIPRGGAGLIRSVVENATVPVIETGVGNCHVYVDEGADLEMGVSIVANAKCSRPSVCNAAETLLVARPIAADFLPLLIPALAASHVELRADAEAKAILGKAALDATEEDWATEYNDFILAVKVVADLDEALSHIARYGTRHSEAIVTADYARSQRFLAEVDAAAVYVNASTRFTDGGEFGLGAEIGISTQKMHARGPMALKELCSYKYIVKGDGQIR
ncbi:MAG: glutamate-5-semialdehyde dehydrogenase [Clostridia bacterium]|nr:glutamate-5-semialdehyde dehydrogenase [Clostridia bacterium]